MRGAVAVELALITVPLVLMVLGAVEFSRAVHQYNILAKSTRDAARLLTAFAPDVAAEYPTAAALNRAVYGNDAGGIAPLVPGLNTSMVRICDRVDYSACSDGPYAGVATGASTLNLVRVEIVGYPYEPMFPVAGILPAFVFGPIGTTMMAVR